MPRPEEMSKTKRSSLKDVRVRDVLRNYSPYQEACMLLENRIDVQQKQIDVQQKQINEILKTK